LLELDARVVCLEPGAVSINEVLIRPLRQAS
jgi:hypothetical protein